MTTTENFFHFVRYLARINHKRWRPRQIYKPKDFYSQYLEIVENGTFMLIGANEGISSDDVLSEIVGKSNWEGLLIEPVPGIFEKLKINYREFTHRLTFINSAISTTIGEEEFYSIDTTKEPPPPQWLSELGSFNESVILKHRDVYPNIEDYIKKITVKSITFESLVTSHGITKIDLLMIDTEGFDAEIIKTIDFTKILPSVIIFEHAHLQNTDYRFCLRTLKKRHYLIYGNGRDTIAILPNESKWFNIIKLNWFTR